MRNREEKKCKKGQETTIGKIIYGFLLFMPLLAIFITCGYAMFNKNAYQSYYGNTINEEIKEPINYDELVTDNEYNLSNVLLNQETSTQQSTFYVENITIIAPSVTFDYSSANQIRFYVNSEGIPRIYLYNNNTAIGRPFDLDRENVNINFTYLGSILLQYNEILLNNLDFSYKTYNNLSFVSEVFYYSIDKVEESNLFNWAQNSIIYTTTNATCNALSINNTFIPLLLSYWLIISVLYFLYDIALMLVWIVHRKIHDLQENF